MAEKAFFNEKYPEDQMDAAFKEVQDAEHWKNPIDKTLDACDDAKQDLITHSVIYYTGSVPSFTKLENGKVRVKAAGYYMTIGA